MRYTFPGANKGGSMNRRSLLQAVGTAAASGSAGCSDVFANRSSTTRTQPASPTGAPPSPQNDDAAAGLTGPWPTAHATAKNTSFIESDGPRGSPLLRWQKAVHLKTDMHVATGPGGPAATRTDGRVLAYTPDGVVRWRDVLDGDARAAPVVGGDGTVVVGRQDGKVIAYGPGGDRRWTHQTQDGLFPPHANDGTPFRVAGETVLLAHQGACTALRLDDGQVKWKVSIPRRTHRPAIGNGRVVVTHKAGPRGNAESLAQAISIEDGRTLWESESTGAAKIGPRVDRDSVYIGDNEGRVIALDGADGAVVWEVQLPDDPWISTIPAILDGRVWVGTLRSGIFGATASGVEAHIDLPSPVTPVVTDDLVVFGTPAGFRGGADASVVAIDRAGELRWRKSVRGNPVAHVRHFDSSVVVGTDSGVIETIATDGTRAWRAFDRPEQLPSAAIGPAFVYYGSRAGNVLSYRLTDAFFTPWGVRFDGAAPVTPTLADGLVFVGDHTGTLRAVPAPDTDPPDGRVVGPTETAFHADGSPPDPEWEHTFEGPIGEIGFGRHVYLGSGASVVSVQTDGTMRWTTSVEDRVTGAPAVDNEHVYVGTTGGTVLGLSTADGTIRWRSDVGTTATAPTVTSTEHRSYVIVGTDESVESLDPESGDQLWELEMGLVRAAPAATDDIVVAGTEMGVVHGIAVEDGSERWSVELAGPIHGAPAIANDTAYMGSRDRNLYALSLRDGSIAWRVELADWVDSSPAVGYGAVVVTDQSGTISVIVGDE